jgi:hypothetical protein
MAKWQCSEEQARAADRTYFAEPVLDTGIDRMQEAITTAVGAEVEALRKSLAEMLEQARRYDAEVATATARAEHEQAERDLAAMRVERDGARAILARGLEHAGHGERDGDRLVLITAEQRALVESWRDAERKDGAK